MSGITSLKPILIFLLVITYLGALLFLGLKYPKRTPLVVELEKWTARPVFIGIVISLPLSIFFAYYFIAYKDTSLVMVFGMLSTLILLVIDLLFTNPKRKKLSKIADERLAEVELVSESAKNSFNARESTEIYNQDYPIYTSGYLVGVALNRVCKNPHDEYFHVFCCNWKGWSELEVKLIDKNMALVELSKKR